MRVGLALAAGFAVVLVALGFVLADTERRQAGSNYVPEFAEAVKLEGRGRHCEREQIVPKDAAALRLLVGTYERPTPALDVSVRAGGATLSSGGLPAGRREGHLLIPLERVERTTSGAVVCIRVSGERGRKTVLYGTLGSVRLEWLREEPESWVELMPTLVHRFSLAKANPVGEWLLPLTALLLLAAWVAAIRTLTRELRS